LDSIHSKIYSLLSSPFCFFFPKRLQISVLSHVRLSLIPLSYFSFFSFAKLILKFLSPSYIYLSQNCRNLLSPFALLLPYSNFYLFLSQNSFCNWLPLLMFVFGKTPLVTLIPLLRFSFARLFFPSSPSFAKLSFLFYIFLLEDFFDSFFSHLLLSFCRTPIAILFLFSHSCFAKTLFLLSYFSFTSFLLQLCN
jgi:hypothetical protein